MPNRIVVTKPDQLPWQDLPGGLKYKFVASGSRFLTGIAVVQPGMGECWHKHADDVEESYYVLRGRGTMSWKSGGDTHTLDFGSGDAVYLSLGLENEFTNTGTDELWILFTITNAEKMRD